MRQARARSRTSFETGGSSGGGDFGTGGVEAGAGGGRTATTGAGGGDFGANATRTSAGGSSEFGR
jgi:hypothetical protein